MRALYSLPSLLQIQALESSTGAIIPPYWHLQVNRYAGLRLFKERYLARLRSPIAQLSWMPCSLFTLATLVMLLRSSSSSSSSSSSYLCPLPSLQLMSGDCRRGGRGQMGRGMGSWMMKEESITLVVQKVAVETARCPW